MVDPTHWRTYELVRRAVECAQRAREQFDRGRVADALSELGLAFSALVGMPGVCPFDAEALLAWARNARRSQNERDCAAFLLHVTDRRRDWGLEFDVVRVMASWAEDERAAFVEWAQHPWWA